MERVVWMKPEGLLQEGRRCTSKALRGSYERMTALLRKGRSHRSIPNVSILTLCLRDVNLFFQEGRSFSP